MNHSKCLRTLALSVGFALSAGSVYAEDCNRNRIDDSTEVARGWKRDCNQNGIPDECDLAPRGFGFAEPMDLTLGGLASSISSADIDADGNVDLVAGINDETGSKLFLAWNEGEGKLIYDTLHVTTPPRSVVAADLHDSGFLHLITAGYGGIEVYSNLWGRFFEPQGSSPIDEAVLAILAGDLDSDGDVDLATANYSGSVSALLNGGFGYFPEVRYTPLPVSVLSVPPGCSVTRCEGCEDAPLAIAAADLDQDGDLDLTTVSGMGTLVVLMNDGNGAFLLRLTKVPTFMSSIDVGDLNADGYDDLAAGSHPAPVGNSLVFLNRGNGTFSPPVRHLGGGESIRASDLDGDADLDLVSAGLNYFSVLLNKGNGTFERAMNFPAGQSLLSISVPDIDGDGFPDLAGAGEEPGVLLLRNQTGPPRSQDLNRNDVCDECEGILFHRGDPSGDARLGLSDPITLINYLFGAGNLPPCRETADVDNDGSIDLSDGIQLFSYLYLGGPPPANPGAPGAPCGPDPDPPGSAEDLGCWVYDSCDE